MDPPIINYVDNNSILVINASGKMRQLFCPFKVQVIIQTNSLIFNSWVVIEQVQHHPHHRLLYRISKQWWPYDVFKLSVIF